MIKRLIAILGLLIFAGLPTKAETYRLKYTVTWGVLVVYETSIEVVLTEDRYRIATNGKTKGLASLFYGGRSAISSEGLRIGDLPQPLLYQNKGKFKGNTYHRVIVFDEAGQMVNNAADWPEEWTEKYPREDVPIAMQIGPDPISNLIRLVNPTPDLAALLVSGDKARFRAYDGRTVFDYIIQCKPDLETLERSSKSVFSGSAHACYTDYELIAGELIETEELKKEREKRRKKEEKRAKRKAKRNDGEGVTPDDDRLKIWLGQVEGAPSLVPVRAAAKTGAGTVRIYLRSFERLEETEQLVTASLDKGFCKKTSNAIPSPYC